MNIDSTEDEIIWEQKLETNITAFSTGFQYIMFGALLVASLLVISFNVYLLIIGNTQSFHLISFMMAIGFGLGSTYKITHSTRMAIIEYSLKQSITAKYIQFEYGLFRKKTIRIPFNKISKITKVGYRSNYFTTIYFNTTEKFKSVGYNFKKRQKRHCPTFEMVLGGGAVYQLLTELKQKNKQLK